MEKLTDLFPALTESQKARYEAMEELYRTWNARINVISRKDMDNLLTHHILHSMAIAKVIDFPAGSTVLDVGTGGGFPGIPLAILFPDCRFKLIDGTGKKVRVAQEVARTIGLENCVCEHLRAEDEKGKFEFVVSRAVMPLPDLVKLVRKNMSRVQRNAIPNGIICLKGGDLQAETMPFRKLAEVVSLEKWFSEEWFKGKQCVYLPM